MRASEQFPHLPKEIREALDDYGKRCHEHSVSFAHGSKFATDYPGMETSDASLRQWEESKTPPA